MINLIIWTVSNYVGGWQFPVLRNCSCDHIPFTQYICLEKNAHWQTFSEISTNFENCLETLYLALVLYWCWVCANVLDKWGLKQLDLRHRISRFANPGLTAELSPVLFFLWKLKVGGCFLHILPCSYTLLELDMLAPLSCISLLQLLLMSQSLHFANQCRHFTRHPCLVNKP